MFSERFSKKNFRQYLIDMAAVKGLGFDRNNGYSQVKNSDTETKVRYGEWRQLLDLIQEIDDM